MAAAVNGTIGGWSPTYLGTDSDADGGRGREWRTFWLLVPPQLLRDGDNDVALLVVDDTGLRAVRRRE